MEDRLYDFATLEIARYLRRVVESNGSPQNNDPSSY